MLVVAIRQDASQPWAYNSPEAVTSTLARWAAAGVLSMLIDIVIACLSVYLVWGLQMDRQSKRLVIIGFVLRLFLIPITIVRIVSIAQVNHNDFSFSYALPETLTQLEMHGSIIATTLPCLRLFLRAWNTSFMDMRLQELDPQAYEQRTLCPPLSLLNAKRNIHSLTLHPNRRLLRWQNTRQFGRPLLRDEVTPEQEQAIPTSK